LTIAAALVMFHGTMAGPDTPAWLVLGIVVGIPAVFAAWCVLFRRHPLVALGLLAAADIGLKHYNRKLDASMNTVQDWGDPPPPGTYHGPAGFGHC
jgi:hypothetical protein